MSEYNQDKFEKLLSEIDSVDLNIQIDAAEELCWFVENYSENLNFEYLKNQISNLVGKLDLVEVPEVGFKLGETIFEFIWLELLNTDEEKIIITRLVNLKTSWIYPSYLDDEDFIDIPGVKDYIRKYKTNC